MRLAVSSEVLAALYISGAPTLLRALHFSFELRISRLRSIPCRSSMTRRDLCVKEKVLLRQWKFANAVLSLIHSRTAFFCPQDTIFVVRKKYLLTYPGKVASACG